MSRPVLHCATHFIYLSVGLLPSYSVTESTVSFTQVSFLIALKFSNVCLSHTCEFCFGYHLRVCAADEYKTS